MLRTFHLENFRDFQTDTADNQYQSELEDHFILGRLNPCTQVFCTDMEVKEYRTTEIVVIRSGCTIRVEGDLHVKSLLVEENATLIVSGGIRAEENVLIKGSLRVGGF